MKLIVDKSNKKSGLAKDNVTLQAVAALPDSMDARRRNACALLTVCPRSRYAERISVTLKYLEQHQADALNVQNSILPYNEQKILP